MSNLIRSNPFEEFFGDLTRGFWIKPAPMPGSTDLSMKIDVKEDDKSFTVKADIPGVRKEDIQVEIDVDRISLKAEAKQEKEEKEGGKTVYSERSYGMVSRSFTLPAPVDSKTARAEYKDGVLNLTLPKASNGAAKRITVS